MNSEFFNMMFFSLEFSVLDLRLGLQILAKKSASSDFVPEILLAFDDHDLLHVFLQKSASILFNFAERVIEKSQSI